MTHITQTPPLRDPASRARRIAIQSRLNNPLITGLIALIAATAIVIARWLTWAHRQLTAFILIGQHWITDPSALPHDLVIQPNLGYDGQFFYRLALDPADLHNTAFGITVDTPYRFIRDGYPFLAWLLSAGQHGLVPVTLVVVNVLAIAAIGVIGGIFASDSGRHAAWGLLLAGYYGLVTTLSRDTSEAVASAFLLAGVLMLRPALKRARSDGTQRRRPVLGGLLLGYASLSRETAIIAPLAYAIIRLGGMALRRWRPGRDDLGWVLPGVIFSAWQVIVYAATGQWALLADSGANANKPFTAPMHAIFWNFTHLDSLGVNNVDEWAMEFVLFALVVIFAVFSLWSTRVPVHERLAFIIYIFEICLVAPTTWNSLTADMRSFIEVWLFGVLILFGTRRRPMTHPLAYRLPIIAIGLVPVLAVVIHARLIGT
ncbi:MAG: hypothetical protein ABSA93_06270 [Streptosporangiaceae bacterium]